jgi:hypothetical protein
MSLQSVKLHLLFPKPSSIVHILDKFILASCPVHILEECISCHKCIYLSKHSLFSNLKQLIFLLNWSPVKNVYIYLIIDHDLLPIFETCSTITIKCICIISLQTSVISTELDIKLLIYLTVTDWSDICTLVGYEQYNMSNNSRYYSLIGGNFYLPSIYTRAAIRNIS